MIHGTAPMISRGCVCNLCTLVQEAKKPSSPEPLSVPTTAAREHLDALVADGWRIKDLAVALGYHRNTLYGIRSGKWLFTSRYIAEDILSVPVRAAA